MVLSVLSPAEAAAQLDHPQAAGKPAGEVNGGRPA